MDWFLVFCIASGILSHKFRIHTKGTLEDFSHRDKKASGLSFGSLQLLFQASDWNHVVCVWSPKINCMFLAYSQIKHRRKKISVHTSVYSICKKTEEKILNFCFWQLHFAVILHKVQAPHHHYSRRVFYINVAIVMRGPSSMKDNWKSYHQKWKGAKKSVRL